MCVQTDRHDEQQLVIGTLRDPGASRNIGTPIGSYMFLGKFLRSARNGSVFDLSWKHSGESITNHQPKNGHFYLDKRSSQRTIYGLVVLGKAMRSLPSSPSEYLSINVSVVRRGHKHWAGQERACCAGHKL